MEGLVQLLTKANNGNGGAAALDLVKSMLSTPTLINPGFGYYPNQTKFPFAIPLETESHQQSGQSEVSQSLVITKSNKKNISDNIAPSSWTWQLSGYIPGSSMEVTNLFTPIVKLNTDLLKMAWEKGYLLIFKDVDAHIYNDVVIQSLTISTQADCKNKTPFSMTLKQINKLDLLADLTDAALNAIPAAGAIGGKSIVMGSVMAVGATVGVIDSLTALL